jgi:enamine deaminase RidA (YjgF/YER057c/UK114 family)
LGSPVKQLVNPEGLVKPVGYSHAVVVRGGRTVYLAGQVSFDETGNIVHAGDMVRQFAQALDNLEIAIRGCGGEMTDIVKLNIFVKDKELYKKNLREIGAAYREYFGKYFPPMTLVEVSSLFEDDALLEIEGIAVIEDQS